MKTPKVQVLLSTYNGQKYLKELMDSVLNQDFQELEILVRDDGSTDETLGREKRGQVYTLDNRHQGKRGVRSTRSVAQIRQNRTEEMA